MLYFFTVALEAHSSKGYNTPRQQNAISTNAITFLLVVRTWEPFDYRVRNKIFPFFYRLRNKNFKENFLNIASDVLLIRLYCPLVWKNPTPPAGQIVYSVKLENPLFWLIKCRKKSWWNKRLNAIRFPRQLLFVYVCIRISPCLLKYVYCQNLWHS
jgi:hypothetical protein